MQNTSSRPSIAAAMSRRISSPRCIVSLRRWLYWRLEIRLGSLLPFFVLKAFEQTVFTVNSESLGCGREGYDFQIGKLGDNTPAGMFPRAVTRFPANSLNMSRIFPNFTMKLYISAIMVINGLVTTNLLNISNMCNFFIINVLQN